MISFPDRPTPDSRDDLERLGEEIAALAAHLHASTYRLLVTLREFDEREGWGRGFASCAHWLSWRTGIAPGAAREKVRVARALAHLPRLSAAMERGALSFSKVRALTRIATPANEEDLLELAYHATAAQVERVVRAWRRLDRSAEAEAERERHESRSLTIQLDDDGSYIVRGRLDPEVGALLQRALELASSAPYVEQETCPASGVQASDAPSATGAQRHADALGLLLDLALHHHELSRDCAIGRSHEQSSSIQQAHARGCGGTSQRVSGRACTEGNTDRTEARAEGRVRSLGRAGRVQVVLHVDVEALRDDSEHGHAALEGGGRVSAETSRRLACDASLVLMRHDAEGTVLDVGRRTRTVPAALRRALEYRDRGCRFPGCANRFVDAHHVEHWADGGSTSIDNLVLLCRRHHRLVHEGGYRVIRDDMDRFLFVRPDGSAIPEAPPLHACGADVVAVRGALAPGAYQAFAPVGERAPMGGCTRLAGAEPPSERLDLDWALRTLWRPREGQPTE